MTIRTACAVLALLALSACASPDRRPVTDDAPTAPESAARASPYAGVWLGDIVQAGEKRRGAIVRGTIAGPAAVAGVRTNDRIVRINGIDIIDATTASRIIASSSPGDELQLELIRDTEPVSITLVIDRREQWLFPSAYPSAISFDNANLAIGDRIVPDKATRRALSAMPDNDAIVQRLDRMFLALAQNDSGYNKLPLIRSALIDPAAMRRWRDDLFETLRPYELERVALIEPLCTTLAISCPASAPDQPPASPTLEEFAAAIEDANGAVRAAFDSAGIDRSQAYADLQYLLQTTASDRTLIDQPEALKGIRAMQLSMRADLAPLLLAATQILANSARLPPLSGDARRAPASLRDIVEGDIVDYIELDEGYVVIGGPGDNRYVMDRLYAVIDVGGDDAYHWLGEVALATQTIIDAAGNDVYRANSGGPGAGWLGASVLIDMAGADHYYSAVGGCGAGVLGFGFLFDSAGADTYECAAWSVGTAVYGAGVLIDEGEDSDVYVSQVFSQGVGGPRGVGILLDAGGGDLYRANGPVTSAYGVAASFMGFSQGVGVGIRPYDFGGVGVLFDYGGDDRYEGGEFAQGGGYLWGVGLLADESGNDLYYGDRYAQGFAAHQAFGMLTDRSGDDVYWSMAAAGQGAAWDQSIALLYDDAGNDVYRAHSLSQGAAAQQSRAVLHDASGDDFYWSGSRSTQGDAGDNSYHFRADDPIYSFGVLLDEAGDDRYTTGLENGETLLRRAFDTENGRGVAGVAIDLP